ncbi:MAG: hypothetical protein R8M11_06265, partial [Gallionella sp.]
EPVVVVEKDAVDHPAENMTGAKMNVQVAAESVRVVTQVTAKNIAKPMVVSSKVSNDVVEIQAKQVTTVQEKPIATAAMPANIDNSENNDLNDLATIPFNSPQSIATDGLNLYVADTKNHKIRIIEIATSRVDTLAGSGTKGNADGFGEAASFNHPRGVVVDGLHLYVTDTGNHAIRKINIVTGHVITLAGSGEAGSADKTGAEAGFNSPRGITIMGKDLLVADYYNQSIRRVNIETGSVTTELPKRGWLGSGEDKLPYFPGSIAINDGNLYVADYDNHIIRKIQLSSGKMNIVAGSGRAGAATGIGKAASFNYPCEIEVIGDALYVADSGNHTIRKIEMTSGQVTKFAGSGSNGMVDGVGEDAMFATPFGLTSYGNKLYVADQGNHEIRQIDLANRMVKTVVVSGHAGSIDSGMRKTILPEKML